MKRNLLILSTLAIIATACDKTETEPSQPYDKGVLVVNSGNFFDNNGSITLIQRSGTTASYDIFQKENLRAIAGGISGYTEVDDKGLILVDNSTVGKDAIEIVNARTFKSVGVINEVENPRNAVKVGTNKAYVVCWDALNADYSYKAGYVAVIDLLSNKMVKKIEVQNGSESIQIVGNEAFVGNTGSGKSIISVIDITTDAVKQTIEIGRNPNIIGLDANNKLWVSAGGELVKFNPTTKIAESRIKITSTNSTKSPSSFAMSSDKKTVYFTYSFYDSADGWKQKGETYSFSTDAATITADKPFINRLFSGGLAVDPQTGIIYAGLVPSFKQAGYVFRYNPTGTLIDSVKAEIAPSKFYFKK
jgi:YVTN family beta-propeller protein